MTNISHVRIPPDSTGQRIASEERYVLEFDNQTLIFEVGDVVSGETSGATGVISGIIGPGDVAGIFPSNAGRLYLRDTTGTFVDNENLQILAVTYAISDFSNNSYTAFITQENIISDPENPGFRQRIDRFGSSYTTFRRGSPSFTPFGEIQTAEQHTVKDYRFAYGNLDELFWDQNVTGGTTAWDGLSTASKLNTITTTGSLASRTSNFYHPYRPGVGSMCEISLQFGDTGKTNLRRRWGLFDDDNGVYFQLDGTALSVVIRSNASGSVVEDIINQDTWSDDKLDGSNEERFDLDVSLGNIYFIDFQWLGAGIVRFGIIDSAGNIVIAHVAEHANVTGSPYMRTGTLPIRVEQENTGAVATDSETRLVCATVKNSVRTPLKGTKHSSPSNLITLANTDGEMPIMSMRPKQLVNTYTNRGLLRFVLANLVNAGDFTVLFRAYNTSDNAVLTGEVFAAHSAASITEIDTTATAVTPGTAHLVASWYVPPKSVINAEGNTDPELHEFELFLGADGTTQPMFIITAEVLETGSTAIGVSTAWEEILL